MRFFIIIIIFLTGQGLLAQTARHYERKHRINEMYKIGSEINKKEFQLGVPDSLFDKLQIRIGKLKYEKLKIKNAIINCVNDTIKMIIFTIPSKTYKKLLPVLEAQYNMDLKQTNSFPYIKRKDDIEFSVRRVFKKYRIDIKYLP